MDKNKLKKEMLEAIFIKTGGRPENPEIVEICAEIAVKTILYLLLVDMYKITKIAKSSVGIGTFIEKVY